jgi:hypothetical protein
MVMATGGRKKSEGKLEDAAAAFWRERDTRSRGKNWREDGGITGKIAV